MGSASPRDWTTLSRYFGRLKNDTIASGICFDDVSDVISKELWDGKFESTNTHGKEEEQAREECAETNLKLLFLRAALNKYSKYGNCCNTAVRVQLRLIN